MTEPLTARYYTADGAAADDLPLPAEPFDGRVHEDSLYAAVTAYLANQRQGTASAKTRSEVRGGGRKPWRQKGTGRARHGSIRSPIWRGGGVIFPPKPKSHRHDLPRKVKRLARRSAFNARASEDRLIVVEELELERPRTRALVKLLEKIGIADEKVLILTSGTRENLKLSGRNLPNVEIMPYGMESAYDVLRADRIVIEKPALEAAPAGAEVEDEASGSRQAAAKAKDVAAEAPEPAQEEEEAAADETEEENDA